VVQQCETTCAASLVVLFVAARGLGPSRAASPSACFWTVREGRSKSIAARSDQAVSLPIDVGAREPSACPAPRVIRHVHSEYFDLLPTGHYHFDTLDQSVDLILRTGATPLLSIAFKPKCSFPVVDQDIVVRAIMRLE